MEIPTKEQYEKQIKKMQLENLRSENFINAVNIVTEYSSRFYLEEENHFIELYSLFKTYAERRYYNYYEDKEGEKILKYYQEMRNFVNSLNQEVLESNYVLKRMHIIFEQGYLASLNIINKLLEKFDNQNTNYEFTIPLSQELSMVILDRMAILVEMVNPKGKIELIHAIPYRYVYFYTEYNAIINKFDLIIKNILKYQMSMIVSNSSINLETINIRFSKISLEKGTMTVDFICNSKQNANSNQVAKKQLINNPQK